MWSHQILLYRRWPFFWAPSISGEKNTHGSCRRFFPRCRAYSAFVGARMIDRDWEKCCLPRWRTKNRLVGRERLLWEMKPMVFFGCVSLKFPRKSTIINILKPYSPWWGSQKHQPWGVFFFKAKHIIYPPVNQHRHIKSPCFLVNTIKMVDFPWLCLRECTNSSKLLVAPPWKGWVWEAESFKKWTCKGDTFCWKLYRSFFCRYFLWARFIFQNQRPWRKSNEYFSILYHMYY